MSDKAPRRNDMSIEYTAHSTERYRAPSRYEPYNPVINNRRPDRGGKLPPLDRQARRVIIGISIFVVLWAILLVGGFYAVTRSQSSGEPRYEPTSTYLSIAAVTSLPSPTASPRAYPSETPSPTLTSAPTETQAEPERVIERVIVTVEVIREITSTPQPKTETAVPSPTETVSALILKRDAEIALGIRQANHKMSLIEFFISPAFIVSAIAAAALLLLYGWVKYLEHKAPTVETTSESAGDIRLKAIPTNYSTGDEIDQIRRLVETLPELTDHPTYISYIFYNARDGAGFYKVKRALRLIEQDQTPSPPVDDTPLDPAFNV